MYRIAFFSDTHLGYAARCRSHPQSGLNMRVRDGFLGLRETIDQILERDDIDVVVHGGDLFHRSHPDVASISWARTQLQRLTDRGIPVVLNTGNHDFANDRGKMPATAAVNAPKDGLTAVTQPYVALQVADGLTVHTVSHVGLAAAERAIPEPVDGDVNVFTAHGAAQVPGHPIFACIDSPGEAVIGYDVLSLPWNGTLLGHYHGMGPLPGFADGGTRQAWYAGSLLRRGFSDPEGGRGWLLVTVEANGEVSYERQYVRQRPQFDFPVVDAAGLTAGEVEERIRAHIAAQDISEAIVRQRVVNCSVATRRGIDTAGLVREMSGALMWQPEFIRPAVGEFAESTDVDTAVGSLRTAGAADLPSMWDAWVEGYARDQGLAPSVAEPVAEVGRDLLVQVSAETETGQDAPAGGVLGDATPARVTPDDTDETLNETPDESTSTEDTTSATTASSGEGEGEGGVS